MHPKGTFLKNRILAGISAAALAILITPPAQAAGTTGSLFVPNDFDSSLGDTRPNGSYTVQADGSLRLATNNAVLPESRHNKVAEYVRVDELLTGIGEPTLDYTAQTNLAVGYQLVVDLDGDGDNDGILVGETVYRDAAGSTIWWLGGHRNFATAIPEGTTAPTNPRGTGPQYDGTLEQWRQAYADAKVTAFGFSLGSGQPSEGVLHSISFNGTTYKFALPVVLHSRDECKDGGWTTSTHPVYKNQGDCVSTLAPAGN